ncbi:MAG: GTP-binding protein [Candidatus Woesearchaeota archaeon]
MAKTKQKITKKDTKAKVKKNKVKKGKINKKIPVTILSGFLGSGKTTLINHILKTKKNMRVALIVNDMAAFNIDGQNVSDKISQTEEKLVQIQNGCICCTLREDLFKEVKKIAKENKYDYLIIESSGISEPLPVAATFTFPLNEKECLSDVAEVDTMVTVVDAKNFIDEYNSTETLKDRKQQVSEEDERSVVDLMVDQLEFANIILVNKVDLVNKKQLKEIHGMIRSINSEAEIIDTINGQVKLDKIMHTKKFNFEKASEYPTWLKEIQRKNDHVPETEEYGISSFVFKSKLPLHPERFWKFIHTKHPGLIRAKGYFWLSTRMKFVGDYQLAGKQKEFGVAGEWWVTVDKKEWPKGLKKIIKPVWDEKFGDRRQEMVFIGIKISKKQIEKQLKECLLTKEELKQDYENFNDPFPKWVAK